MSVACGSIDYGKDKMNFAVVYADRKTMEIAVHPDARVVVKAPRGTLFKNILARVTKRARWIKRQLDYFRQFEPRTPSRLYVGGATHLFLGRQYRLKIRKACERGVKLKGKFFYIATPDPADTQNIKTLLDEWYIEHARTIFEKRLELWHSAAKSLKIPHPKIRLRRMLRRWGSCGKAGYILLNTKLVTAPLYCIDYVIVHELCHLKDHTHGKGFYKLLSKYMPDWGKRKERLERFLI
jgi:hypothetical protein